MILGDIEVSLTWRGGAVSSAVLYFKSRHPWLEGQTEDVHNPGFFRSRITYGQNASDDVMRMKDNMAASSHDMKRKSKGKISLTLSSPNRLRLASSSTLLGLSASVKRCSVEADKSMPSYYTRHSGERDDVSAHWIEGQLQTLCTSLQ